MAFFCQKAGCVMATTSGSAQLARRRGWQIPTRPKRGPHDVAGIALCPECSRQARKVVHLA